MGSISVGTPTGLLARVPGDFGLVDHVWPVRYEQALRDGRQRLAQAGTIVPASAGELVCAVIRRLPDLTLAARWLAATPPPRRREELPFRSLGNSGAA